MMDSEQFSQLIEKISRAQEDHDLLISIKASLETYQTISSSMNATLSKEIGAAAKAGEAAHRRIDTVISIGGLSAFLTIAGLVITVLLKH